jgi:alkylation response protein AidB-like acyl-CoA dehydrogenase
VPLTLDDDTTVVLNVRATDVTVVPTGLSDATRRAATITFTDLHVPAADVLLSGPRARAAVDLSHARLAVALAADSAGGAAASLALATEYAKTRHQFGRAIGSFQAIKHKLADMYIGADSALAMATQAAEMLDTNPEHAYKAVLAAAAHCTAAYVSIAGDAIQIHGGIGFTWEHVCHRFLKRAWLNQTMLGGQRKLRLAFADSLFAGA